MESWNSDGAIFSPPTMMLSDSRHRKHDPRLVLFDSIVGARRNFRRLKKGSSDLQELLVLSEATPGSDPSWFGFLITVREDAPFSRNDLTRPLNQQGVATRNAHVDFAVERVHRIIDELKSAPLT